MRTIMILLSSLLMAQAVNASCIEAYSDRLEQASKKLEQIEGVETKQGVVAIGGTAVLFPLILINSMEAFPGLVGIGSTGGAGLLTSTSVIAGSMFLSNYLAITIAKTLFKNPDISSREIKTIIHDLGNMVLVLRDAEIGGGDNFQVVFHELLSRGINDVTPLEVAQKIHEMNNDESLCTGEGDVDSVEGLIQRLVTTYTQE